MTILEVVDSAVKIGLGASITALFALISLRRTQQHDFKKELFRRRLEKLEEIAKAVQAQYKTAVDMTAEFRAQHVIRQHEGRALPTVEDLKSFQATAKDSPENALALHNAEGIAYLIEAPTVASKLDEYRLAFAAFQQSFANPMNWPVPEKVIPLAQAVRTKKDEILRLLADEFKKA